MSDLWYSSEAMIPPRRVPVRVMWQARKFEALRTLHPKRRKDYWATIVDDEYVFLPPRGKEKKWGEHPELWQPIDPATWSYTLPIPVPLSGTSKPSPPMEASLLDVVDPFWWRNAEAISYSEKPHISLRESEGRVMRAINTDWAIHDDGPVTKSNAVTLSRLGSGTSEYSRSNRYWDPASGLVFDDAKSDWRPKFRPTGIDRDDYGVAFSWFRALNPPDIWKTDRRMWSENRSQRILRMRAYAPPYSWLAISIRWKMTQAEVKAAYQDAMEKVFCAANGLPVLPQIKIKDQIEALKERNRKFKSGEFA